MSPSVDDSAMIRKIIRGAVEVWMVTGKHLTYERLLNC